MASRCEIQQRLLPKIDACAKANGPCEPGWARDVLLVEVRAVCLEF